MSTCTPIYGLHYASGSDRPCDIGDTLCQFATDVENQLDIIDSTIDRIADSPPMAQVRLTVPFVVANGGTFTTPLPFDTVDFDTADMVNLVANPYVIQLPRFGRYLLAQQITATTVVALDAAQSLISAPQNNIFANGGGDGASPIYLNAAGEITYQTASPLSAISLLFTILNATITVTSATLSAFWIGDTP